MFFITIFTKDIIHAIVMTCLAFFNQQQTLFRRQSVKSEDMTKFNGLCEMCSVLQYPRRLSSYRPYSHCHHTHLLGIDGILRMRWWKTVTNEYLCCYLPRGCVMTAGCGSCFRASNIMNETKIYKIIDYRFLKFLGFWNKVKSSLQNRKVGGQLTPLTAPPTPVRGLMPENLFHFL